MADPRKVWQETFSVLKQILGMGDPLPFDAPKGIRDPNAFTHGSALLPPSLPVIQDPTNRMGRHQQMLDRQALDRPGAVAFDALPMQVLTDEEERVMNQARTKAMSDQGRTYRPPERVRVSLPPGVLVPK